MFDTWVWSNKSLISLYLLLSKLEVKGMTKQCVYSFEKGKLQPQHPALPLYFQKNSTRNWSSFKSHKSHADQKCEMQPFTRSLGDMIMEIPSSAFSPTNHASRHRTARKTGAVDLRSRVDWAGRLFLLALPVRHGTYGSACEVVQDGGEGIDDDNQRAKCHVLETLWH
jgi:hypothetical protein